MTDIPNHVEPGDIIKSADFNSVVDVLADLESRVAELESGGVLGGGVVITSIAPEGDLRVGQEITIFGRNFGYSIGAQRVFFNSVRVTIFKTGSSDEKLIIEIPDVPNVSESGTPVTMSVANFTSSASKTVTLKPVQLAQQGNVSLSFLNVTPATVTIGSTPKFTYQLEAPVMLPQLINLDATVSIGSLQAGLKFLDASDHEIQGKQLTLQPGASTQISVQLGAIPGGTVQFSLDVEVNGSGINGSEDNRQFTIGETVEVDEEITTFAAISSSPDGALSGNTVSVASGASVIVKFRAEFTGNDSRTYDVQLGAVQSPAVNWQTERGTGFFATPATYPIAAPGQETPAWKVTPLSNASSTAVIVFTLQRQGSNKKRTAQLTFNKT
ncbi:MAG TPA: IPT/TIG domain-containing protein [Pyrinomonadaceae bacterium]|nr:IPT/TIG domain-containing protein [Pyrinomonadaceae bacterium]